MFLKTLFGVKAPHKWGVDAVQAGLLNMSAQEKMWGRVFWRMCFGESSVGPHKKFGIWRRLS